MKYEKSHKPRLPNFKMYRVPNPTAPVFLITLIAVMAIFTAGMGTIENKLMSSGPAMATARDMTQAAPIDLSKVAASPDLQRALFAGGCFWGTQYAFSQLPGVSKTLVGYTGGKTVNPTYEQVCGHGTKHAETVYIEFDPKKITYKQLADYFWTLHDPTTKDRQGMDFGDQYRSEIFYTSEEQKAQALDSLERAQKSGKFGGKIVTLIEPATIFYPAEEYHQNYDIKHGSLSCPSPRPLK